MELRRYLRVLRQRWVLVLLTIIAAIAAAYVTAPKGVYYTAEATILVGPRQFSSDPESEDLSSQRTSGLDRLIYTYAVLIDSEPVAQEAIALTGIERSSAAVVAQTTVEPVVFSQLLTVTVVDASAGTAQALANGMADAFIQRIQSFEADAPATEGTVPEVEAYVFEQARLPTVPTETGVLSRLIVAALFGFLASVALMMVLEYLDLSIRTAADAERLTGLPVLGAIPTGENISPTPAVASPSGARRVETRHA